MQLDELGCAGPKSSNTVEGAVTGKCILVQELFPSPPLKSRAEIIAWYVPSAGE